MNARTWIATGLLLALAAAPQAADYAQFMAEANAYYVKADYLNAFQLYQQALRLQPESWEANQGVGNALYGMGRHQSALDYYRRSLQLNPGNAQLAEFAKKLEDQLADEDEDSGLFTSGGIDWLDDYNKAMEQANRERKLMLVLFYTEFSAGVPLMDRKVFADKRVQELSKKFVCVRIDGNQQRQITKSYRVDGYPTVVFADGQEQDKGRGMTVKDPDKMLALMEKAMAKKSKWRGDE